MPTPSFAVRAATAPTLPNALKAALHAELDPAVYAHDEHMPSWLDSDTQAQMILDAPAPAARKLAGVVADEQVVLTVARHETRSTVIAELAANRRYSADTALQLALQLLDAGRDVPSRVQDRADDDALVDAYLADPAARWPLLSIGVGKELARRLDQTDPTGNTLIETLERHAAGDPIPPPVRQGAHGAGCLVTEGDELTGVTRPVLAGLAALAGAADRAEAWWE
jgi:hypothetical protein